MAKLETFFELEEINVTASVGSNGVNLEDDVMVVQALLKYALAERGFFRKMTFSEPTGTMDDNTKSLIKQFQRFVRKMNNADISVDGRIDPAKGKTAFGKKGQWTIQILNGAALGYFLLSGAIGETYIHDICRRFPQTQRAIGDLPVGSLGLTLEPSVRRGIGSLGLALG